MIYILVSLVWVMKNFFKSLLNLFNIKEKTIHMTISELNAFNIREEKIEKERRFRAYISEINQRYNKIRKRERNSLRKAS